MHLIVMKLLKRSLIGLVGNKERTLIDIKKDIDRELLRIANKRVLTFSEKKEIWRLIYEFKKVEK